MTWHLVADTACDLHTLEGGKDLIDFGTIPFTIRIGGKEYIDDENMDIPGMLEANESHDELAQTACPSPEDWRARFSAPGPVIAFTISSALSGSYNSACTARTMLLEEEPDKQIAVIDSKATGPEEAMLVWAARDLILSGMEFSEIEKALNETAERIHTSFALASYHNLIKAGARQPADRLHRRPPGLLGHRHRRRERPDRHPGKGPRQPRHGPLPDRGADPRGPRRQADRHQPLPQREGRSRAEGIARARFPAGGHPDPGHPRARQLLCRAQRPDRRILIFRLPAPVRFGIIFGVFPINVTTGEISHA